jgi:hypothetical protein
MNNNASLVLAILIALSRALALAIARPTKVLAKRERNSFAILISSLRQIGIVS